MKDTLLWAIIILTFGALVMVCALMLLKRSPSGGESWGGPGGAGKSGPHLKHLSRLLRAIRAINNVIVADREKQQLLEKACRILTETRGYKMAWIGLVDPDSKQVKPLAEAGVEKGYLDEIEVTYDDSPTGRGPTGQAIRTGEPSVMRDLQVAPEYKPWREQALERGYRSSAALPLRFGGRVLGALSVYSDIPAAFDIEEVGLLQEVSDHLAFALSSIELEEELAEVRRKLRRAEPAQSAFRHSPLGILTTDAEGRITGINPQMSDYLSHQVAPERVSDGARLQDLDFFSGPETSQAVERLFSAAESVQFRRRLPGGADASVLCRGKAVCEEGHLAESVWVVEELPESAGAASG